MALFKNLYLDVNSLNPFKKKKETVTEPVRSPIIDIETNKSKVSEKKELPNVSKRLLEKNDNVQLELPKIDRLKEPPKINAAPEYKSDEIKTNIRKEDEKSFFSNLYEHINKEDSYLHSNVSKKVLYKNLFGEMQNFWENHRYDTETVTLHNAVKADLAKKVEELQELEIEWQKMQLQHDTLKDQLAAKEILIESRINHLKKKFKRLHLTAHTHQDHHFILKNGTSLKNLQELQDELLSMDDSVFKHHVNEHRNDFSNWVNDVMNLPELADDMVKADSKLKMASMIENWQNSN